MKSMTGYGSAKVIIDGGQFNVGVRTINHRFCETIVRVPPILAPLEPVIKQRVGSWFARGRIEITMNEEKKPSSCNKFKINKELANEHLKCVRSLEKIFRLKQGTLLESLKPTDYLLPLSPKISVQKWWKNIRLMLDNACKQANVMRRREGKALENDQKKRVQLVDRYLKSIKQKSLSSLKKRRAKLKSKLKAKKFDHAQIAQEESSLISKLDVAEEITRLFSHIQQHKRILRDKVIGRKLDFLLQEMHREITTLSVKAGNSEITALAVDLKAELERLREQAHNIE